MGIEVQLTDTARCATCPRNESIHYDLTIGPQRRHQPIPRSLAGLVVRASILADDTFQIVRLHDSNMVGPSTLTQCSGTSPRECSKLRLASASLEPVVATILWRPHFDSNTLNRTNDEQDEASRRSTIKVVSTCSQRTSP